MSADGNHNSPDEENSGPENLGDDSSSHDSANRESWLKWSDQYFIGSIGVIVFLTLLLQWGWFQSWSRSQATIIRPANLKYQYSIDINSATAIEWSQLEGIGEVTAQKILDDLRDNGPFKTIEEVQRVSGIGEITLEKIRPYLRIGSEKAKPTIETAKQSGS